MADITEPYPTNNVSPGGDIDKVTFGPPIITVGVVGTTPVTEIGYVTGDMTFTTDGENLDVLQGSPQSLIKRYRTSEEITFDFSGIEWNLDNIRYFLGAGTTSSDGASEVFKFGGDCDIDSYALRVVHRTCDGGTIDIQLFKAQGNGGLTINLNETELHQLDYSFAALEGTTDFEGSVLGDGEKKYKIVRTPI